MKTKYGIPIALLIMAMAMLNKMILLYSNAAIVAKIIRPIRIVRGDEYVPKPIWFFNPPLNHFHPSLDQRLACGWSGNARDAVISPAASLSK